MTFGFNSGGLGGANLNLPAAPVEMTKAAEVENLSVEEYVGKYFSDIPVLVEVARCESRFRHEDKNGRVLRGEVNEFDRGVMQINELYHLKKAKELGFDITTLQGNVSYARYLFEKEGLRPWNSSSGCWKKSSAYSEHMDLALRTSTDN